MRIHQHINHNDMRNRNLALILNFLHQNSPISRAELSSQLGINKASISKIIRDLIKRGIVVELGAQKKKNDVGAPAINLMINPDAGRTIAVEVTSDYAEAIISDLNLKFLWKSKKKLNENDLDGNLSIIKSLIDDACIVSRNTQIPIIGLSLGIPGMVDINKNIVLFSPELGWDHVDLNCLMDRNIDIPFYTGNEAHMSALGEMYFGLTQQVSSSIFISWGKEIRGGIIVNQNVMPGGLGLAGEIGHYIIKPDGEFCTCGKRGCWNSLINQDAIFNCMKEKKRSGAHLLTEKTISQLAEISLHDIILAAKERDEEVISCLQRIGYWLGIGISNLINLTNPEIIIIGGPLRDIYEFMSDIVEDTVNNNSFLWQRNSCHVQLSSFGKDSCLIGGIATIIWNILNNPLDALG